MIKQVITDDLAVCVEVIKESFTTVAEEFNITRESSPCYVAYSVTEEKLKEQLEDGRYMALYCDENERVLGFFSLIMLNNWECELSNLCVLPEHRHGGIGGKLLEHAFDVAKNAGCIKMNIGIIGENVVLRKWYERYGAYHLESRKYDFFPFTCGYMEKVL